MEGKERWAAAVAQVTRRWITAPGEWDTRARARCGGTNAVRVVCVLLWLALHGQALPSVCERSACAVRT